MSVALAVLLGWTDSAQAAKIVKGKIKRVIPDKNQIVVTDEQGKDHLIHLNFQTRISLDGKKDERGQKPRAQNEKTLRQLLGLDLVEGETICYAPGHKPGEVKKGPTPLAQALGLDPQEQICLDPMKLRLKGLRVGDEVAIHCREKDKLVLATEIQAER